ncbi:C40 family peptidase [Catellatospora tritici]|uniref:C40 family peptidase n=1 Tax=Catellatospora tritici TaxID=2851566 RepID=UPI001C2CF662|nr:C40 family peptidase [Catellatospora tritici]MBV1852000.1 C40 family peptidase [Catellatospora tritici]
MLSALIAGGVALPAGAEPPVGAKITSVPDIGARPSYDTPPMLPAGRLSMPVALPTTPKDALNAQYYAADLELSVLHARRSELQQQYTNAMVAKAIADYAWRNAADRLREAKQAAEKAAVSAYQHSAHQAELDRSLNQWGELNKLLPRTADAPPAAEAALRDLARVQLEERQAFGVLAAATDTEHRITTELTALVKECERKEAAFLELKRRLAELQSEEDRRRELEEQNLGANYDAGQSNAGLVAAPKARQAVMHALAQRGKPYVWGNEGPNSYDCSGLVWASYRSAGITLNRVARDQYYGTRQKTVSKYALLPGDLLFFATDPSDWRTIHHVGMYLGNGRMVHARTTGDVVKIAPVNLYSVDFATRVVDALPAPSVPTPSASASPSPSASASPSPSASASPSPSSSTSPSPSASPSASSSPSPAPAASPSPEPPASPSPVAESIPPATEPQ